MKKLRKLSLLCMTSLGVAILGLNPLAAQSLDPVHVYDRNNNITGNGVRFHVNGWCAIVSPFHVVALTSYPEITPSLRSIGGTNVVNSSERLDVAIIRQNHADPSKCGKLPTNEDIRKALRSAVNREVRLVNSGGTMSVISVDLIEYDNWDIELRIKPNQTIASFQPGNSGALVVFDGVPVGILTDGTTGSTAAEAKAIRLDYVLQNFPEQLTQPVSMPTAQRTDTRLSPELRKPYDISQLPTDFQAVVREARLNKRRAEQAAAEAKKLESAVEKIVQRARLIPQGAVRDGLSWFMASGEDKTYYGEVALNDKGQITSRGLGLIEWSDAKFAGNRVLCKFSKDKGCEGLAVYYYAYNEANSDLIDVYRGGYKNNNPSGYGHLTWKIEPDLVYSGFYPKESWGVFEEGDKSSPEVWITPDGRRYEGEAANRLNGIGVIWGTRGQVSFLGVWQDGALVKNVTKAWRDGTYISGSLNEDEK